MFVDRRESQYRLVLAGHFGGRGVMRGMAGDPPAIAPRQLAARVLKYEAFWVYLLIFSFVYDRPIVRLFGFLRSDPRLFDFVLLGFLFYVLSSPGAMQRRTSTDWFMKKPLQLLIGWATIVVILQFVQIPWEYQRFSIFYLMRYFQLYIAVWLIATSSLTDAQRHRAINVFLFTVIVASAYGLLQYLGIVPIIQYTSFGTIRVFTGGAASASGVRITSTLGYHYAYFGGYSVLGIVLVFLSYLSLKKNAMYLTMAIVAGFVGMVLSQALSAYGTLAITGGIVALMALRTRRSLLPRYLVSILLIVGVAYGIFRIAPSSVTARFTMMWEKTVTRDTSEKYDPQDPYKRFSGGITILTNYFTESKLTELMFGRGFYIARGAGEGRRIGYGVHNIFIFMLEQAGPIGFFIGLYIIWVFIYAPWLQIHRREADPFQRICGTVIFAWAAALIVAGLAGQIFWIFESLTNWFTVVLCIWSLLIRPPERIQQSHPSIRQLHNMEQIPG